MIKTFEEACQKLGGPLVEQYNIVNQSIKDRKNDLIAYMKLRIICEVLNEGWKPDYTKNESVYCPWFYIYTEEETRIKKDFIPLKGGMGIAYAGADGSSSDISAFSGISFKSRELSDYCGTQFLDIWADFILPKK